jgi:hypothetical protein
MVRESSALWTLPPRKSTGAPQSTEVKTNIARRNFIFYRPLKEKPEKEWKTSPHSGTFLKIVENYSTVMALQGQASTQAPQLTQESSTITALSPSSLIASAGQASTQAPQPAQVSLSILAAIFFILLIF